MQYAFQDFQYYPKIMSHVNQNIVIKIKLQDHANLKVPLKRRQSSAFMALQVS